MTNVVSHRKRIANRPNAAAGLHAMIDVLRHGRSGSGGPPPPLGSDKLWRPGARPSQKSRGCESI